MIIKLHDKEFVPFIAAADIQKRVKELGEVISQDYAGKMPLFIGLLNGSFIFTADLMRACACDCEVGFVQLASYHGLASTGNISMLSDLKISIEGRHIIVVEDIIDTGNTLHFFLEYLQSKAAASVEIASLLLKPSALQRDIKAKYIGFEIPNDFVVGYGLDYDGLGRNIDSIFVLKP